MNIHNTHSILILDDDDTFRTFVANLLESRGLEVIQARSVTEAMTKLGANNPLLAIVDYRLPESDGITWITKLREDGRNFPIVFLSGIWCDEKTFDWLRNILRVSLILQKPIVAELFLQQIESLLPKDFLVKVAETLSQSRVNTDIAVTMTAVQSVEGESEKSDLKSRIAALRQNYAGELSAFWQNLKDAIDKVKESPDDTMEKTRAIHLAHKMRGTAGSIGFVQVGETAGKLEDLLQGLDPQDPLRQVVWSEIVRAVSAGDGLVKTITEKLKNKSAAASIEQVPLHRILIIGNPEEYSSFANKLSMEFCADIDIVDSGLAAKAKIKANQTSYSAVIVDLSIIGNKQNLLSLTKDIRLASKNNCVPLALILDEESLLDESEICHIGVSFIIERRSLKDKITIVVEKLITLSKNDRPKILIVDDDEVLTKFLSEILSGAGMVVQSLHKPIKIVSVAESFNPDLVLLDVMMPGLSGYDVCRILRATEKWQNLPILFLTSKNDQESRSAAFQAGGNDFLSKPVLTDEVLARVRTQLENVFLKKRPLKDDLTKVLNRNDFVNIANSSLTKVQNEGIPATICMLLIEDFVKLGLQHGLFSMQTALSTLGDLLSSRFKPEVIRGRLSEDTFALVFVGENAETVEQAIISLRNEFADIKFTSDSVGNFKTLFSIGLSNSPDDGTTLRVLLDAANQRLSGSRLSTLR